MKQFLRSLWTLLLLMMWCSVGFAQETLTGSWDLTKTSADWTATNYESYFSQPYGYKKANGTLVNKSIADFSTAGITQIKVGFKCQQTGTKKSDSKITIYLVDAKGNALGTGTEVTPKTVRSSTNTSYQYATFTSNLEEATGFMMKVTKFGKNILVNGASYEVTYNASTKTKTTLTFPEQAITINGGDEANFKGQSAKLYAGEQELTDKTIKYAHTDDDIFATFDETTGAATLKSGVYGTATVTATYAGDDTYEKAVASYTVTVKNPNVLESTTTYDFVNNTYGYPQNGNLKNGAIISNESPVTIVNTKNGTTTQSKFNNGDFRNYKAAVLTINAKEGCLINKITITGTRINQLNLNGKDGTWNNGVWTGSSSSVSFTNPGGSNNSVCFETITIEYTAPAPITLDENADDTNTKIEANKGKTIDVKLIRSLKAGAWNTICLPFDVTTEQIKNILKAEGMVREYADDDATAQTITFKKVEGNMKAGEPYLIKPTEDITSLAFEGVTITAIEGNLQGKAYGICGTLGKYTMKTDGTELFLNAAGKFVAPAAATNTMKGFRAYFMVPSGTSAAAININIDGETTGINSIETEATVNGKVYNLNGQYVGNSLNGLKKGIYVVNGKKVIK